MKKKLFLSLRWLTAIAVLCSLTAMGYQCLHLYHSDTKPLFSAEKVMQSMQQTAPLLMCCLAMIVLSVLFHAASSKQNLPVPLSSENRLRLMKKRISSLPANAQKEEKKRLIAGVLATGGILICIAWCLAFLLNRNTFHSWDLDQVMENMLLHVIPALILSGLILYIVSAYCDRSRERECSLLRSISREMSLACPEKKNTPVSILRIVLLSAAILFIVLGALNGGMQDLLSKAIKICTECIGLG